MWQRMFHICQLRCQYNPFFFVISLTSVFVRVRFEIDFHAGLSLVYDSLSMRSVDLADNGRGAILLDVDFTVVLAPVGGFTFTTPELGLTQVDVRVASPRYSQLSNSSLPESYEVPSQLWGVLQS